ncbi:MAG: alpha/beta hydrolase [Anaerolineae bacterium]
MRLFRCLLCLLILLMAAPVQAQDELPRLETTDCWMELPEGVIEGDNIQCGYLVVPEDRSDPDSPTISLAVAVLRAPATATEVKSDPVIYLAGGPGSNAMATLPIWLESPYLQDRDLVLLDQRGTGYSLPSLNCSEMERQEEGAVQLCHDRLIDEGINLQAYNSVENAADVADLRVALGYDEWNLFGISYGTRLALTIMRDHPEGVRSVVLDSVYPPEISSWEEFGQNIVDVVDYLFQACANDLQCSRTYPDLEQEFYATAKELNANPASYTTTDSTGNSVENVLTGDTFVRRIVQSLYTSQFIPYLPFVINQVANGNYAVFDDLESGAIRSMVRHQLPDEDVSDSEGMGFSVDCQEELAFMDVATALDNIPGEPTALYDISVTDIQDIFSICQIWGVEAADQIETQPVESDIPTLVVAGEFDPVTPPHWAKSAASHLPNSFYFLFPGGGHGVIELNDCSRGIMQSFLNDPTKEPDASCIDDIGEVQWMLPE